jgi:fatty-acyl-CoA synthase
LHTAAYKKEREVALSTRHYDWIAYHAGLTPKKLAAVDLATDRRFTYGEFDERIGRVAGHLQDVLGVLRGDRVAVLAMNDTDVFEIQFACMRLGAVFVPLNWRLTVPELTFIVGDVGAKILIHDVEFTATATALQVSYPDLQLLEHSGRGYEQAIVSGRPLAQIAPAAHDDIVTIMYTSGTTGQPKGAIITYGMHFWNAINLNVVNLTSASVTLTFMPLFHIAGLNNFANPVFHVGGTVVVMRAFDPAAALGIISDARLGITHFLGAPAHFLFMAQCPAFAEADFSRLEGVGVGAAPMPVSLLELWQHRGVTIQQGYGMTETGPATLFLPLPDAVRKTGSSGKPVLYCETRIMVDGEREAAVDEVGELWVKGPSITPGYWNRPDANKASFTDGWLHTGDLVRRDEEGFFYIVDRSKDMYISGGENVYPAEVENVLYQIPAVGEAAVIGVADERWGEVGRAIIAVKPGHTLDETAILAHCRANLAGYKNPRSVRFVEALPRNATGKVHKPTLRQQFGTV